MASPDEWAAFTAAQLPARPPSFAHAPGPVPGPCPECGTVQWRATQVTSFGTAWQCRGCGTELVPELALTDEETKRRTAALLQQAKVDPIL